MRAPADTRRDCGQNERRIGDNHHHLVCDVCGSVQDVDCAVGMPPCMQPATDADFVVREAEVTFWGTCASCRSA
jgi:Fur family ferric uptake transcriptional regulator